MKIRKHNTGSITLLPALVACAWLAAVPAVASENAPHAPFGQWADVPAKGQLVAGLFYQESEAYHIWAGGDYQNVTWIKDGEEYGIDVNQGHITLQYGITERWAADLAIGYTTAAWRYFANDGNTNGAAQSTTGLMDISFGVRYQIWNEATADAKWKPTLTFRAGAVMPGSYEKDFPFAPGDRSASIEPQLIARKHFGWDGFGAYADGLFRWNRTTHNDHWIVAAGFFQQIKTWELNVGYRHLGTVNGDDIVLYPDRTIDYPRKVRENNDSIEAGLSYTTQKRGIQIGFYSRTVVDGSNSDGKFWVGGYVNVPFQIGGKAK
jgi:hypothetical protein